MRDPNKVGALNALDRLLALVGADPSPGVVSMSIQDLAFVRRYLLQGDVEALSDDPDPTPPHGIERPGSQSLPPLKPIRRKSSRPKSITASIPCPVCNTGKDKHCVKVNRKNGRVIPTNEALLKNGSPSYHQARREKAARLAARKRTAMVAAQEEVLTDG